MKTKIFALALAALTLAASGVAAAQEYGRRDRDWRDGDWRGRNEIVVRQDGRTMSFDRGDRMFYRLLDRPFNFRPGLSYAYTDRCNRWGCRVIVFSQRAHRVVDTTFAPRLFDGGRGGGWDRRDDDGRGRGYDGRDGDRRNGDGGNWRR